MNKEDFNAAYETSVAELAALRQRKAEEMQKIDSAATQTKQAVKPLLNQLEDELKQAAAQVIDLEAITPSDLEKTKIEGLKDKLGRNVTNAVRSACQKLAEKIQLEIQRGLAIEVERLSDFTETVSQTLNEVEMQFVAAAEGTKRNEIEVGNVMPSDFSGMTLAAVGLGSTFALNMVLGVLFGAVLLPIPALIIGAASISGFSRFAEVTSRQAVENFKADYKTAVFKEIEKQLKLNSATQKVNDSISDAFTALKRKVSQETETLLQDTQNTLNDLRGKKERDEALNKSQLEEFNQMRAETQKILDNAHKVSEQLIQIMSV